MVRVSNIEERPFSAGVFSEELGKYVKLSRRTQLEWNTSLPLLMMRKIRINKLKRFHWTIAHCPINVKTLLSNAIICDYPVSTHTPTNHNVQWTLENIVE